jgi:hypothetical protein
MNATRCRFVSWESDLGCDGILRDYRMKDSCGECGARFGNAKTAELEVLGNIKARTNLAEPWVGRITSRQLLSIPTVASHDLRQYNTIS